MYSDFIVEVTAYEKSDFQEVLTEASDIVVLLIFNKTNGSIVDNPKSKELSLGKGVFNSISVLFIGNFEFRFNCERYHSVTLELTVYGYLKVTFPNNFVTFMQPEDYMTTFDVLVEVYSDQALTKKYSSSYILIHLKAKPNAMISGIIKKNTNEGKALFTDILIKDEDYYVIFAVNTASKTGRSKQFDISNILKVYSIKGEIENPYVEREKEFTIKVCLYRFNGNPFPFIAALWLKSSKLNFEGENIKAFEFYKGFFTIKLLNTGTTEISIASSKDSVNVIMKTIKVESREPYCGPYRRSLCDGCTTNAIFKNNICSCIPLAIFNPKENIC